MIEKLKNKEELTITGHSYDERTRSFVNRYEGIRRKPNNDEIIEKINEIIDYLNKKEESNERENS